MKVHVIMRTLVFGDGTVVRLPMKIMRKDDAEETQKAVRLCEQLNRETAQFCQAQLARVTQGGAAMLNMSLGGFLQTLGVIQVNHMPAEMDFPDSDLVLPPEKRIILS